jgi:hypothetical protein
MQIPELMQVLGEEVGGSENDEEGEKDDGVAVPEVSEIPGRSELKHLVTEQ